MPNRKAFPRHRTSIHLNHNQNLKQSDFENDENKIVEQFIPISLELNYDCNFQNSINEN